MKILKFKTLYSFNVKEKCDVCDAKLELEEKDIKLIPFTMFGIKCVRPVFSCPICKNVQELTYRNAKKFALYKKTKKYTK